VARARLTWPVMAVVATILAAAAGCAGMAPLRTPDGPWVTDSGGAEALEQAMAACRGVRTLTAEIAVGGRVGGARLRGRVLAGVERGGSLRLEAPAPFGAPIFVLAARGNRATLWLPRDRRILRGAPVDDVLEAIVGLRRSSDDLLAMLTGCLTSSMPARGAAVGRNGQGWLMATWPDATVAYVKQDGATWRLFAGHHGDSASASAWTIAYDRFASRFPDLVRVSVTASAPGSRATTTLALEVSQRETNVAIEARAFEPLAAPDAATLTLEELRQIGPLADRSAAEGRSR
jgi:hypothetical protein